MSHSKEQKSTRQSTVDPDDNHANNVPLSQQQHTAEQHSSMDETRSMHEWHILEHLSRRYHATVVHQQIAHVARTRSMRETTLCAIMGWVGLATIAVTCLMRRWHLTLTNAVLYSTYTMTSAGLGTVTTPPTNDFFVFAILLLWIAIAAMTSVVAQTVQYFTVELLYAKHERKIKKATALAVHDMSQLLEHPPMGQSESQALIQQQVYQRVLHMKRRHRHSSNMGGRIEALLVGSECRKALWAIGILVILLLYGTAGMMLLEGWTFVEALYFAMTCMTTTGYGDTSPTNLASYWFVIVWLHFDVVFLTLFLLTVAHGYTAALQWNTNRILHTMRQKSHKESDVDPAMEENVSANKNTQHKDTADESSMDMVLKEAEGMDCNDSASRLSSTSFRTGSDEWFLNTLIAEGLPPHDAREDVQEDAYQKQPKLIRTISNLSLNETVMSTHFSTMKDLVDRIHYMLHEGAHVNHYRHSTKVLFGSSGAESNVNTTPTLEAVEESLASQPATTGPSLALRILVQERLAEIIAMSCTSLSSKLKVSQPDTLLLSMNNLTDVVSTWKIPSKARDAFYRVAFHVMAYVGLYDLQKEGSAVLLQLPPHTCYTLLAPFVVALGSVSAMERWKLTTDIILQQQQQTRASQEPTLYEREHQLLFQRNGIPKESISKYFPVSQGNAVLRVK
jgi:hypothetical protein